MDSVLRLKMKMISSLEKCFYDDTLESKEEKNKFIMFRNERLSFQVMYRAEHKRMKPARKCPVRLGGDLAKYARLRLVSNVVNMFPIWNINPGGEYIRTEPGAYPDMLRPLIYPDAIALPDGITQALWIDIELPKDLPAGEYSISVSVFGESSELLSEVNGSVRVIDAELPCQKLIHTEWFYTDCIANYYHCRAFSEKHWRYIESFMRTAVRNGINMILTPVFTPEIDTYVGGERLTTQLVDIELTERGIYKFGFEKLHRWIDLCLGCGVEYFEIPHFFTQWGATAAPKIIVKVNGRKRKYFGWHTDSKGAEYKGFLSQFIPALLDEFKKRGLDKKCFFHVSDEPKITMFDSYRECKDIIDQYLEGYPIIDAMSDFEFYSKGIMKKPVPGIAHSEPFLEAGVPDLWVYYCGCGGSGVTGRQLSMPLERTRILGVQLYLNNIEGFLHWGYNFYNSNGSHTVLDPYGYPDGGYFTPSGDCFIVYPGTDGEAWESIRLNAMREAMDDMRALSLYETKFGREATERLIMEGAGDTITFTNYPTDRGYLISLREKIAEAFA